MSRNGCSLRDSHSGCLQSKLVVTTLLHLSTIWFVLFPTDMILLTCSNKHHLPFSYPLLRNPALFMSHGEAYFLVPATKPSASLLVEGLRRPQIISCLDFCLKPEPYRGLNKSLTRIWYQKCLRCSSSHHNTYQTINVMLWSADAQNLVTVSFLAALTVNKGCLMITYWLHRCWFLTLFPVLCEFYFLLSMSVYKLMFCFLPCPY